MRIIEINKFFRKYGGTEQYLFGLIQLAESKGHRVIPFSTRHQDNLHTKYSHYFASNIDFFDTKNVPGKIKALLRVLFSFEAKKKISNLINDTNPDIAHLHNIAHQLSPSILYPLKHRGIPVVQTLHDYKLVCPTYKLFAKNRVCERCIGKNYFNAVLQRCNKGSFSASAANALEMYLHRIMRVYKIVDLFISPSKFLRSKVIESGVDPARVIHLPNFLYTEQYSPCYDNKGYFVFFGQLNNSKGVDVLLRAIKNFRKVHFVIAGEGEHKNSYLKYAAYHRLNVSFPGFVTGKRLADMIRGAAAVMVPSVWYENQPYTVLEAFAFGKPVVGSRLGGIAELIEKGKTGLLFEPGNDDDLSTQIEWLLRHPNEVTELGKAARLKVEREFHPTDHYKKLMRIFHRLLRGNLKAPATE